MDFEKRLRQRLYIAIIHTVLGIALIIGAVLTKTDNGIISSFGLVFIVMGMVRIRNYFIITKNEETLQKQKIAENDERNISIVNKARSLTYTIYGLISGVAVFVLSLLNMHEIAQILSFSLCTMLIIYRVAYWAIRKNS